jgi:peptidoglycan LD-endopeptidase LytH
VRAEKRRGGPLLFATLGGFVLGAATVLLVVWVYGVGPRPGGLGAPRGTPRSPGAAPPAPAAGASPGRPAAANPSLGAPSGAPPSPEASPPAPEPASPPVTEPGNDGSIARPPTLAGDTPEVGDLRRRHLLLPVQGKRREDLVDSFFDGRAGHRHEAIDIMAPRNTPVMAVEDGRLVKLFFSQRGGNTIYQFDPGSTYAYYYAHLERYAEGLREGDMLRRGQVIGYVGSSGDASADAPHLHFAIFLLTPEKHWWQGAPINPFEVLRQP